MASDCSGILDCLDLIKIHNGDVIFEVCCESDNFKRDTECQSGILMNKRSQYLVIDENGLQFESKNKEELMSPDGTFVIQFHKYLSDQAGPLAVTISVQDRVVVCYDDGNNKGVKAKPLKEVPTFIEGINHEAIFYKHNIKGKSSLFKFESSLVPKWFLGFELSSGAWLLVLKKVEDEVDQTCEMQHTKLTSLT